VTLHPTKFRLFLMGAFCLTDPYGSRIAVTSQRARALLAMLATARAGERTRTWLQDRLWGSRGQAQAQASLRRELSNLRPLINRPEDPVLCARNGIVGLNLERIEIDVRDPALLSATNADFLEGIDLPGEEAFEDWLRDKRRRIEAERQRGAAAVAPANDPHSPIAMVAPLAGRPSISVVASVEGTERADAVLIEGMVEMLVERISRLRWLAVVAAPVTAFGLDDAPSIRTLSARLGASYLLHAQLAQGRREIRLVLSEGATGRLMWSRRYSLEEALEGRLLAQVAAETVAALAARIEVEQQLRVLDRGIQKLNPNELVWRARWHMRRLTRDDAAIAARLLDEAAAENPNNPAILIEQAFLEAWRIWASRGGNDEKKAFRAMVLRARQTDPYDARAYHLCGVAEMWLGNYGAAKAMFAEALELNPSLCETYGQLGSCNSLSGDPLAAIPLVETALRLNPLGTESFHQFGELALAKFMLGRHREAIADADRSLALRPAYFYAHAIKIAALTGLRDAEGEARAREALGAAKPFFRADNLDWLPFKDRRWIARLRRALDPPPRPPSEHPSHGRLQERKHGMAEIFREDHRRAVKR
jgi:tetratricopeptide (TPR) repeat protein